MCGRSAIWVERCRVAGASEILFSNDEAVLLREDAGGFVVEDGDEFVADDFAFCLGVGDSGELARKRSLESTATTLRPSLSRMVFWTLANSSLRRTPLLTKMQVRRSPMARCTRTAATEESTPPERPQMAWPVADFFADGVDGGLDEVFGGPVGLGSADVEDEVAEEFRAVSGVVDFGMELHGPDMRAGSAIPARALEVLAVRWKPAGGPRPVAVGHPDGDGGGEAVEEGIGLDEVDFGMAVLACRRG